VLSYLCVVRDRVLCTSALTLSTLPLYRRSARGGCRARWFMIRVSVTATRVPRVQTSRNISQNTWPSHRSTAFPSTDVTGAPSYVNVGHGKRFCLLKRTNYFASSWLVFLWCTMCNCRVLMVLSWLSYLSSIWIDHIGNKPVRLTLFSDTENEQLN